MPTFPRRRYPSLAARSTVAARYRTSLQKHPFLLFGLPFIATMVAGSFFLTPATAVRYEKHDRKVRQMSKEEELGIGKDRRKVDMAEEYYRLAAKVRLRCVLVGGAAEMSKIYNSWCSLAGTRTATEQPVARLRMPEWMGLACSFKSVVCVMGCWRDTCHSAGEVGEAGEWAWAGRWV